MSPEQILACDVGETRFRVALVGAGGKILAKEAISTPSDDPGALLRLMRSVMDNAEGDVAGAVVGAPGPIDYSRGMVLKLPNLPNWQEHISTDKLGRDIDLPVHLANDADLAALGEHRFGSGAGSTDMLYVTSSTGVGAGVILGGRLLHGVLSLAEAGHTIIDRATRVTVGSLDSGTALTRLAGDSRCSCRGGRG